MRWGRRPSLQARGTPPQIPRGRKPPPPLCGHPAPQGWDPLLRASRGRRAQLPLRVKHKSRGFQKLLHPQSQLPCLRNPPPCLLNPHFNYFKIMLNPCINTVVASPKEFHYSKLGCCQSSRLKSKRRTDTCNKDRYCFQDKKARGLALSDRPGVKETQTHGSRNLPFYRLKGKTNPLPPSNLIGVYFSKNLNLIKY